MENDERTIEELVSLTLSDRGCRCLDCLSCRPVVIWYNICDGPCGEEVDGRYTCITGFSMRSSGGGCPGYYGYTAEDLKRWLHQWSGLVDDKERNRLWGLVGRIQQAECRECWNEQAHMRLLKAGGGEKKDGELFGPARLKDNRWREPWSGHFLSVKIED